MAIQNRRGNFADFDPFKMLPGEFGYVLDTEELYYCVAPGNVRRVATKEDIVQILDTNQEAYDGLQQLLIELENETVASGILNDISDLLVETAQHDSRIDSLENRTTINETNIAENNTNLDTHLAESVSTDVHGLAWEEYTNLTLQNGWTGTLRVRKHSLGLVHIYGEITPGVTDIGTTITNLPGGPEGYRSGWVIPLPAQSSSINLGGIVGLAITTSGNLNIYGTAGDNVGPSVRINYLYRI